MPRTASKSLSRSFFPSKFILLQARPAQRCYHVRHRCRIRFLWIQMVHRKSRRRCICEVLLHPMAPRQPLVHYDDLRMPESLLLCRTVVHRNSTLWFYSSTILMLICLTTGVTHGTSSAGQLQQWTGTSLAGKAASSSMTVRRSKALVIFPRASL